MGDGKLSRRVVFAVKAMRKHDLDKGFPLRSLAYYRDVAFAIEDNPAPETRPSWDDYFLGVAEAVSKRADCRRRKVGAVIVSPDKTILATGYNGVGTGEEGCLLGACPRGLVSREEYPSTRNAEVKIPCISTHAEVNAIKSSDHSLWECTIYVSHEPCEDCESQIRSAGMSRVVWPTGEKDFEKV